MKLLQVIIKPRNSYKENHQIMENNNTKAEVLKPIFLKAGIPLAITVAGFIFAKLRQRTRPITSDHVQVDSQPQEEGTESNDSSAMEEDIDHYSTCSSVHNLEASIDKIEIESSKIWVQEVEAETKRQELMLLELHNKLSNEIAKVELSERQISALEAEMSRLKNNGVIEYIKILKLLAISELENGFLRKKVKKLLKKNRQQSHLIKEQSLKIEAKETEIQRNYEQLEVEANVRINMEAEIEELKSIVAELQTEKNELVNQIESTNKTISSKIEEEEAAIKASYERVVSEMEQLVNERVVEAKELVYLRWCNACLRHELMRRNQEQLLSLNHGEEETSDIRSDDDIDYSSRSEHTPHRPCSKRVKIIQKLKKWMDRHESKQRLND